MGSLLATVFGSPVDTLPSSLTDLLDRLARTSARHQPAPGSLSDAEFRRAMEMVLPDLRGFARGLTRNHEQADDLVQDTLMRAWAARDRFQGGTSFRAWAYVIARNLFYSERRRDKFKGDWGDGVMAQRLSSPAAQEHPLHLADVAAALEKMSPSQREALLLVGASGMSYEEAAEMMGSAVGTIRSRVSRGREMLEGLLNERSA